MMTSPINAGPLVNSLHDVVNTHTAVAKASGSGFASKIFSFPVKAFHFVCSVPGHAYQGTKFAVKCTGHTISAHPIITGSILVAALATGVALAYFFKKDKPTS